MNLNIYIISFCISLAFAGTILYLIRKRRLREQYALLWLLMSVFMMALSLFPSLLDEVAQRIHIYYAPSLLYLLSVVAVLFILLHLTMAVSTLTHRVIVLTQTLGLQEQRIQKLEAQAEGGSEGSMGLASGPAFGSRPEQTSDPHVEQSSAPHSEQTSRPHSQQPPEVHSLQQTGMPSGEFSGPHSVEPCQRISAAASSEEQIIVPSSSSTEVNR
ncbi:DUF2304 domain-containing protein [Paenibacillus cellulositrophicus]|uniref:DUF2304 domain-containing protein n=1 Tax=Paenibacillus cellulositrophicus TaxID=562959 RepID=UPI001FCB446B|nr:DUF2304 domain-containing protein [Paenibacillus cellulositrophicus]